MEKIEYFDYQKVAKEMNVPDNTFPLTCISDCPSTELLIKTAKHSFFSLCLYVYLNSVTVHRDQLTGFRKRFYILKTYR